MKHLLIAILVLSLLLAGCSTGNTPTEPTTEPSQPAVPDVPPDPPEPPKGETILDGAVTVYTVSGDKYQRILGLGDNLLLKGEQGLALVSAKSSEQIAVHQPENKNFAGLRAESVGVSYFLPDTKTVVILNPQLEAVSRIQMPDNLVGEPVTSIAREEIYYSTGSEIRALHINTGISRLVRACSTDSVTLAGLYFDGTVLGCVTEVDRYIYISAESGQTLAETETVISLDTCGDQYFMIKRDGAALQMLFGIRGGETPISFMPGRLAYVAPYTWTPILTQNGVLAYSWNNITEYLTFFPLTQGEKSATVAHLFGRPRGVYADEDYIWVLTGKGTSEHQSLYRWDVSKTEAEGTPAVFGPIYTRDNPDSEGLAEVRQLADTYESKYDVKVHLWNEALECTGPYTVVSEWHPQVFEDVLRRLDQVLYIFPENFLRKTVDGGWIHISLVRSIEGGRQWAQFWDDGDCWILLTPDGVTAEHLRWGLAYAIDSHVLGNSRDYDTWGDLNPSDFAYSYSDQPGEVNQDYLQGDTRYFIDEKAMISPREDRCSIFFYSTRTGYPDTYKSEGMQAKLVRVCKAIREAYGLEKSTDSFAWERDLAVPLAYNKK